MASILNISGYRFVDLAVPARWRESIHSRTLSLGLKGTVLLATEGINLFLAGPEAPLRDFMAWLRSHPEFAAFRFKESWSDTVPFGKLVVKVKPEIIRMDLPAIRPQTGRARTIEPTTLARWLDDGVDDEGREVVMLDTRNAFEVDTGRFRGAIDWRLGKFTEFPQAFASHGSALADKTVVTYCTGGIRCEKAALLMAQQRPGPVWQLEGGILNYLECIGGRHFEGTCFVFDERVALNDTLSPVQK